VSAQSAPEERGPQEGGMEILAARHALFEIDLALGRYANVASNTLDHFPERLLAALPTLWEHRCMMGEPGGFVKEMRTGTDLAHVVEHVLLELLHLADPEGRIYTGWTNPKKDRDRQRLDGIYTIHYQINSAAQGRLAARCGVELVEGVLAGAPADVEGYLARLRESFQWTDAGG
jgi:cyanophycin synthetase